MIPGQHPFIRWPDLLGTQATYPVGSRDSVASRKDAELVMLFTGGASMTEIGKAIGISRERVRQRLRRMGYAGKDHHGWKSAEPWIAQHRRREAKATAREARFDADTGQLRALGERLGRIPTLREAARALGASEATWQGTGSAPYLARRGGRKDGQPYRPFIVRFYVAAGLTVRKVGAPGHVSPRGQATHCRKGHPFSSENTYVWSDRRWCRTCNRARKQASYQRNKSTVKRLSVAP